MHRSLVTFGFASLLVVGLTTRGQAQTAAAGEATAQPATRTIWDGVYTEAQAERGERTVEQNCGACHSPTDWSTTRFIADWSGHPVRDLHNLLRNTMPYDSPGRLTPEQYADIVAYMLRLNDAPPGSTELPSDDAGLRAIAVTAGDKE